MFERARYLIISLSSELIKGTASTFMSRVLHFFNISSDLPCNFIRKEIIWIDTVRTVLTLYEILVDDEIM